MTPPRWPREWGPDTPLERARTAARVYRDLAEKYAPQESVAADRVFRAFRETWLFPFIDDGSEWITLHQFADLGGYSYAAVRQWYLRTPTWGSPPERHKGRVRRVEAVAYIERRAGITDDLSDAA